MENKILSKVINEKNFHILTKNNIVDIDFYTQKETYAFLKEYVSKYGEVPAYQTVVSECEDFEYQTEVFEHFTYLAKSIKNATAKRRAFELLQNQAASNFSKMNGTDFVNWLADESNSIKASVTSGGSLGTNYATNGVERKEMYLERKEKGSNMFIPTPYKSLTKWLCGGFELGDYVLLQAFTNRGKSFIASDIGVTAWNNGFGVLHYSPELSKAQQLDRLDTMNGHFMNSALRTGELSNEDKYFKYLEQFKEDNQTPYLVKTMGDMNKGLSIDVIEADLQANDNISMVIIDGFNLMSHKGKDGNRNNMSNTSRKLRQIFGKYGVVGILVHQTPASAEKGNDESGARIVEPAEISKYSETIACIQDACTILSFDQADGVGKMLLSKCRTPNVGKTLELQCDFNRGYIKEVDMIDFI